MVDRSSMQIIAHNTKNESSELSSNSSWDCLSSLQKNVLRKVKNPFFHPPQIWIQIASKQGYFALAEN